MAVLTPEMKRLVDVQRRGYVATAGPAVASVILCHYLSLSYSLAVQRLGTTGSRDRNSQCW